MILMSDYYKRKTKKRKPFFLRFVFRNFLIMFDYKMTFGPRLYFHLSLTNLTKNVFFYHRRAFLPSLSLKFHSKT